MEQKENFWGCSSKELIDYMKMDTDPETWNYLSNILQHRYAEQNTRNTKRLVWATSALAIITFFLFW